MYLTDKKARTLGGSRRDDKDHTEIEIILESAGKEVEGIVNEIENSVVRSFPSDSLSLWGRELMEGFSFGGEQSNLQSSQEIAELILDANRNTLLGLDLKVRLRSSFLSFVRSDVTCLPPLGARSLSRLSALDPQLSSRPSLA